MRNTSSSLVGVLYMSRLWLRSAKEAVRWELGIMLGFNSIVKYGQFFE